MIKVKVLNRDFIYNGKIKIRIDDVFVHISASGYIDNLGIEQYSTNYNIHDVFMINEVESIKGLNND